MRQDRFYSLGHKITSLSNSTFLEIRRSRVKVILNGRCSPYISHQTVTFEEIDGIDGILFKNTSNELHFYLCNDTEGKMEWVPVSLVEPLWEEANKYFSLPQNIFRLYIDPKTIKMKWEADEEEKRASIGWMEEEEKKGREKELSELAKKYNVCEKEYSKFLSAWEFELFSAEAGKKTTKETLVVLFKEKGALFPPFVEERLEEILTQEGILEEDNEEEN